MALTIDLPQSKQSTNDCLARHKKTAKDKILAVFKKYIPAEFVSNNYPRISI